MIQITIADNGTGIENKMLNEICEPYVTTKTYGTGLGLSKAKKIIEEHNSKMSIYNTEYGASVSFNLNLTNV